MKVSEDKKSVNLSINGILSAHELTTLIAELAVVRANMRPEVPKKPPLKSDEGMSVQDDPRLVIIKLKDDRIRFGFRNAGLGWLVFNFPSKKACSIRDYLIANTQPSASDLFINDKRDKNTLQ
ncbi:hypothetical protein [Nitrosomonas communis]|uniref:Uncharacterized protein n=1 Tax=Nitrosomonas communis TaxID=44574 RepID=A0A1I4VXD7_9PROT|nr:hypothetical protein [Nitrosomonas communis]SFN05677.1 hypothetical protein SAMN05421863_109211 [Nitrosomonas communis]